MFEKAKEVLNKQLESKEDESFNFNSSTLNEYVKLVYTHSEATYYQIEVVTLAMFGFVFGYGGLPKCGMYVADISDSGLGKSDNVSKSKDLLLRPIFKFQEQKQKKASREFKSDTNKEPRLKKYMNIFDGRFYLPGLLQTLEATSSNMIILDEMGDRLKRNDEVIPFLISAYGKTKVQAPHLKSENFVEKLEFDSKISFIGLSSTEYLGNNFEHHLKGGLFNRCIPIFNKVPRAIEFLPNEYEIDEESIKKYNDLSMQIISFSKDCDIKKFVFNKEKVKAFHKELHQMKLDSKSDMNDFSYFYVRVFENFLMIAHILHYMKCFESKSWINYIADETIEEAISFVKQRIFNEIPKIIDYLIGIQKLDREETYHMKITDFLIENQPISQREIVRKFSLKRNDELFKIMGDDIELIPGTKKIKLSK